MTMRYRIRQRVAGLRASNDSADPFVVAETIARHLRSGSTLIGSFRIAARSHAQEWCRSVVRAVDSGSSFADVIETHLHAEVDRRHPDADLVLTLQVLSMAARVGGEPTLHIDALVETLRQRRHAAADRLTHASTAIASIRLLTWLPVGCAVWISFDNDAVRRVLVASPIGWSCLSAGLAFNLIGRHWTDRLVRRL